MAAWKKLLRHPVSAPALLALLGLFLFGPHAPHAGLHLDDHALHRSLAHASWADIWRLFLNFVPGRNLDMLYQGSLYKLLGPSVERQHWFGVLVDILNALLAYGLCRRLKLSRAWALVVAGLFLVWPNHAETHFWLFGVAQNLLSTFFVLAAFYFAGWAALAPGPRVAGTLLLYALALFDYDQPFFLWLPLLWFTRLVPGAAFGRRLETAFAGACLAMNLAHVLLRIFVPVSSGGRPVITFGLVLSSLRQSLTSSLAPLRKLPVWECLQSWAGGPVPTLLLVLALAALWLACVAALRPQESDEAPSSKVLAMFGIVWFFCAYLPNYFWYISPRHNYLPSFGLLLALSAAARAALARGRGRRLLAAAAFLAFGLSSASALSEGFAWTLTAGLHERFRREAPTLLPTAPDNLFLLGAPTSVARAPAFQAPEEASSLFHEATGHFPAAGGLHLSPGRTGAFYGNEVELFGWENLRWRAYDGMNVLAYGPDGSLRCARRLSAGGLSTTLTSAPRCEAEISLEAPVWLESSSASSGAERRALFTAANGAELLSVSTRAAGPGWSELELLWRSPKGPIADFAAVVVLRDAAGAVVHEPVYRAAPKARALLWPAHNELQPASGRPSGRVTRERYRVKLERPLPDGPLSARVTLFERRDGPWRRLGTYEAPLR